MTRASRHDFGEVTFLLRKEWNFEETRKGKEGRRSSLSDIVPTIRLNAPWRKEMLSHFPLHLLLPTKQLINMSLLNTSKYEQIKKQRGKYQQNY